MKRVLRSAPLIRGSMLVLLLLAGGCASRRPLDRIQDDPRGAYTWSLERLERGKCLDAKETLRLLSLEHAGVPYIDSIVYHLARAYMCDGDFALAQIEYERVVNNYPTSSVVDDAAFGLAYAQFKQAPDNPGLDQQDADRSVQTLQDFIAIYPRSDRRAEAEALLREMRDRLARKSFDAGRLYLKLDADSSALIYFQKLWDEYTQSAYAARALWLLAEKARKREQWDHAIERYEQLIAVYPNAVEVERARVFLERIRQSQSHDLFDRAEEARRRGDRQEALHLFEEYADRYPEGSRIGEVLQKATDLRSDLAEDGP